MSVLYACLLILFRLLYAAGDAHLSCRRCTFSNRNISPRPTRSVWLYYFKSRLVENNSSPGNCIKKNVSILLLLFFIREIAVRWMTFSSSSFPFWLFGRLKSSAERKNGGCAATAIIDRLCCCALRDSLFAIAASLSLCTLLVFVIFLLVWPSLLRRRPDTKCREIHTKEIEEPS